MSTTRYRAFLVCLSAVLVLAAPSISFAFTDLIDTLWQNTNPVPRENCRSFLVKAWPDKIFRGRTSPHQCLVNAIHDYRNGDHEEAMGWLQAGVCPDRDTMQLFVRHAPAVLDYLQNKYGPDVPFVPRKGS